MQQYTLSSKADDDIDDITDYTLEQWGENQTQLYIDGLLQCFQSLAHKPALGHSAAVFAPHLQRYNYKAQAIFYEPTDKGIYIVRVLGQQRDFKRYL